MCFNQPMSCALASGGLISSIWLWKKTKNAPVALGVFYFFLMEFLQVIQYSFIALDIYDPICATTVNKVLTMLGFLHICYQPYFCQVITAGMTHEKSRFQSQFGVVKRLCLIGGTMLAARAFMPDSWSTLQKGETSTEWLRGENLCTYHGEVHLAWAIPMADVTYYVPGVAIHSFLMFAPFLAMYDKPGMVFQGVFLLLTGPVLAAVFTPNLQEQASIWCFFSIAQLVSMIFVFKPMLQSRNNKKIDAKKA